MVRVWSKGHGPVFSRPADRVFSAMEMYRSSETSEHGSWFPKGHSLMR